MKWREVTFMDMVFHAQERIVFGASSGWCLDLQRDVEQVIFTDQTRIAVSVYRSNITKHWIYK